MTYPLHKWCAGFVSFYSGSRRNGSETESILIPTRVLKLKNYIRYYSPFFSVCSELEFFIPFRFKFFFLLQSMNRRVFGEGGWDRGMGEGHSWRNLESNAPLSLH